MSVKYDLYQTPSSDPDDKSKNYHARVISSGLVTSDKLAKQIEYETSLTEGDVKAVLTSLSHQFLNHLSQGERVHIEGIGYFQLGVTCEVKPDSQKIRAEHIKFKNISFLPEKKVKQQLSNVRFVRSELKNHSRNYSAEEISEGLTIYFKEHPYISRSDFQKLFGLTKTMALKYISGLLEQGLIKKGGMPHFPIYEPANDLGE